MLLHVRARNLGVIRDAAIDPDEGLTVITGETGAGKTLLLGGLRLLLGEPADSAIVGPFGDAAQADGILVDGDELGISRVVPSSGRSRSYLDGVVASAAALAQRAGAFVEIVGQHDKLELTRRRRVLSLLDANMDGAGQLERDGYASAWVELRRLVDEAGELGGSDAELARELDLVRHQHREIDSAGFRPGDDLDLEHQESRLRNAHEIREHLGAAVQAADAMDQASGELVSRLRRIGALDPGASQLVEDAESVAIMSSELGRDLRDAVDDLVDDPEALARIDERLTLLGELKRKYGKTVEEILAFADRARERERELASLTARAASIDAELEGARAVVGNAAGGLRRARQRTAKRIEKTIVAHLSELGLETATVSFHFEEVEPGRTGGDRVEIHFASHAGLTPGPLTAVASGGELSRLILAISLATSAADAETLVFDEVDAGVGGATALAMGRKLADLAQGRQVLCVTHLPQVAAFADSHFVISRSGNEASIRKVEGPERLEELSRMIAGLPESDRGQQAAIELLELSGK